MSLPNAHPIQSPAESPPLDDIEQQKIIDEAIEKMTKAFHDFHETVQKLQKEQQDVIAEIQKRIDEKKIADIHSVLNDSMHNNNTTN